MPSQNMLPKGKRRHSVRAEYRTQRTLIQEREAALRAAGETAEESGYETGPGAADQEPPAPQVSGRGIQGFQGAQGIITSGARGSKVAGETQSPRRYPAPPAQDRPSGIQVRDELGTGNGKRSFTAEPAAAGLRLDAYLAKAIPNVSRSRVALLIESGQVRVDGQAAKGKQKLKGGETIEIEGEPRPVPLRAEPENLPLAIVYEDEDLAVVDKPAGMMVHAGSGSSEHNRGTLVNALLHHFGQAGLSRGENGPPGAGQPQSGEAVRPGIVHRLDKQTSGLVVIAKNDVTHRKLGEMFSGRRLRKVYLALVHGWIEPAAGSREEGTITLPVSRDMVRRTRMTTRRAGGRSAISHWKVLERIEGPYGKFTLVEVRIETGRTHQIRVHMEAIGHPVVGDFLYGAPRRIVPTGGPNVQAEERTLHRNFDRNFLHAAKLEFAHPRTGKKLELQSPLPAELVDVLEQVRRPSRTG